MASADFPLDPNAVRSARRFVDQHLDGCSDEDRQVAALLVSELATNAVTHADSAFTVTIERVGSAVRIAVRDAGGGVPVRRDASPRDRQGRGLMLLDQLATDWGVRDGTPSGKEVWFVLGEPAG